MFAGNRKIEWRYFRIELFFFILLSYLVSVLSDVEYSFYEEHNIANFTKGLASRFIFGTFAFLTYGIYYWFFLKPYVFKKRTVAVAISMLVFLVIQHMVRAYLSYWVVIKLPMVSDTIKQMAADNLAHARFTFTISYAAVREVIPLIGFTFLIRSLQQEEQMKVLKEQQLLSELNYLKAQLHPHFFFNTMNNIYSLALKQSKDTASVVARLADMMRYILYEADQSKVPLTKEVSFLSNYIEVERIRHQHNTIQFDAQGINDEVMIEPLLLLPFIENAFKHGLEQETGKGHVKIILCIIDKELTLDVSNSKPIGLNPSTGIGLQNVSKRLQLLYPDAHDLQVNEKTDVYNIILTLQLK